MGSKEVVISEKSPVAFYPNSRQPIWTAGEQIGLTRVQRVSGASFDVSTIRNSLSGWYETIVFGQRDGKSLQPVITETLEEARKMHNVLTETIAAVLRSE